jgi:hypothetical protein
MCIELVKKRETRNVSLNMLVSLINGPEYFNLIDGATDTVEFLNFFTEAAEAVNREFKITRFRCTGTCSMILVSNIFVHVCTYLYS